MNKGSFKDYHLSDEILKALTGLGYEHPTEVQTKVIPLVLERNRSCGEITNRKWEDSFLWDSYL